MRAAKSTPPRPTKKHLDELATEALRSCRCDGGSTNGCGACRAEHKLNELITAGHVTCTAATKAFTSPTYLLRGRRAPKLPLGPVRNIWKDAVEDACICSHVNFFPDDPRKSLSNLIQREVTCALDPIVSEPAHELLTRYLVNERKVCPHKYEILPADVGPKCPTCQPGILVSRELLADVHNGEERYDRNGKSWLYCGSCNVTTCPWCYQENWRDAIRKLVEDDLEELILDGELKQNKKRVRGTCQHCDGRGPLRHGSHPTRHGKIAHEGEGSPLPYER